jgi:predicted kinase
MRRTGHRSGGEGPKVREYEDERLRFELGENLKRYLENVVSWEVVARQYDAACELARTAARSGRPVVLEPEF